MKVALVLVTTFIGSIVTGLIWPDSVPWSGAVCGLIAVIAITRVT